MRSPLTYILQESESPKFGLNFWSQSPSSHFGFKTKPHHGNRRHPPKEFLTDLLLDADISLIPPLNFTGGVKLASKSPLRLLLFNGSKVLETAINFGRGCDVCHTALCGTHRLATYFAVCLPKFDCHDNSLGSLDNSDNIFAFADPENPTIHGKRFLKILYRSEISTILAVLPKFGCYATPLASLNILITYLNLQTPKIYHRRKKCLPILYSTAILANCSCHGNSFCFLENWDTDSVMNSSTLKTISMRKIPLCLAQN